MQADWLHRIKLVTILDSEITSCLIRNVIPICPTAAPELILFKQSGRTTTLTLACSHSLLIVMNLSNKLDFWFGSGGTREIGNSIFHTGTTTEDPDSSSSEESDIECKLTSDEEQEEADRVPLSIAHHSFSVSLYR